MHTPLNYELDPSKRPLSDGTESLRPWYRKRLLWGTCAGILWLLVFAGGILIDSLEYRVALGWARDETTEAAAVGRLTKQVVRASEQPRAEPGNEPFGEAITSLTAAVKQIDEGTKAKASAVSGRWVIHNFACAFVFFTPTNLALLALLAGFIGGCASNLADRRPLEEEFADAIAQRNQQQQRAVKRRIYYLNEHPLLSMMRSFIVYLILISGVYVISSDPFRADSQTQGLTQYMRLAGLVSLLGFVVGYDPTRFEHWLKLVPSPGRESPSPETPSPQATF